MKSALCILLIQQVLQCSGQLIGFPSCSICRTGETIGLPDVVAPSSTVLGSDLPCSQIEANATIGSYRPAICQVLRFQLSSVCSCTAPLTESPTAAPVVAAVTDAPVAPGSSNITLAPSVAPTSSPIDGTVAPAATTTAPVAATSSPTNATTDAPTTSPVMVNTTAPTAGTTAPPTVAPATSSVNTTAPIAPVMNTTSPTSAPIAPVVNTTAPTSAPVAPAVNTTAPTSSPVAPAVNTTTAPTSAPVEPSVNTTTAPTSSPVAPSVNATTVPTSAPVTPAVNTTAPIAVTPNTTAPTMAPTTSPSAAKVTPVASPTASPVATTSAPTEAPVVAPTTPSTALRTIESTAFIRLDGVTTKLTDGAVSALEAVTTDYLKEGTNGVTDETCTVVNQKVVARRALRVLQETNKNGAAGVEVEVKLVGKSKTVTSEDFGIQTRSALEAEAYKIALKEKDPVFEQITKVVIGEKSGVGSSGGRDVDLPEDENKGLKAGIIFVIVVGFLVAVCSIVGGAYYLIRSGSPSTPSIGAPIQEYPVEKSARPSADIPESPMNSAAAAAAAPLPVFPETSEVESSGSKDPSVIKSLAGESEMEGYSVAAGQVDGGTTAGQSFEEGTSASPSGDEMSSHAMSSLKQNMVSRTVIAPPGKLGIVIDTTLEGPVVHKVNAQSPLEGSLFSGDIIVAIDDVDTRAMSASAITALMVRTANLRRTLTVLSEDNST